MPKKTEAGREVLRNLYFCGSSLYATDGRILIKVNSESFSGADLKPDSIYEILKMVKDSKDFTMITLEKVDGQYPAVAKIFEGIKTDSVKSFTSDLSAGTSISTVIIKTYKMSEQAYDYILVYRLSCMKTFWTVYPQKVGVLYLKSEMAEALVTRYNIEI